MRGGGARYSRGVPNRSRAFPQGGGAEASVDHYPRASVVPDRSLVIPDFSPVIPALLPPVIPAKAGIHRGGGV